MVGARRQWYCGVQGGSDMVGCKASLLLKQLPKDLKQRRSHHVRARLETIVSGEPLANPRDQPFITPQHLDQAVAVPLCAEDGTATASAGA
jgi:hypothetical protein